MKKATQYDEAGNVVARFYRSKPMRRPGYRAEGLFWDGEKAVPITPEERVFWMLNPLPFGCSLLR